MICKRESADNDQAHEAYSTPFLIFYAATCALIGAIAYKWLDVLL